jgi:hypothetical protein
MEMTNGKTLLAGLLAMSTEALLKDFARVSESLAYDLKNDCKLKNVDRLLLENYLLVIQLAYRHWQRRNVSSA